MIKFCTQTQPGVLPYFMEDFCKLISHEAKIVRNNAYELFVKLLRFDPNLSQQLIVPFIGCLESNDASIAGKTFFLHFVTWQMMAKFLTCITVHQITFR